MISFISAMLKGSCTTENRQDRHVDRTTKKSYRIRSSPWNQWVVIDFFFQ